MSKIQYALLVAFISFYALLFISLLVRACAGCFRARRGVTPKIEKVSEKIALARRRAWTRAISRGKLIHEMQRIEHPLTAR
jgi:hypothetical protein